MKDIELKQERYQLIQLDQKRRLDKQKNQREKQKNKLFEKYSTINDKVQ